MAVPNPVGVLQHWKTLDLAKLQRDLDETASELATKQDESEVSRKALVEQSKEFKKTTPEDARKVVTPLLKSFQAEVDNLSKRSKFGEAAFLNLYKKIVETPDPVPALENAVSWQRKAQRVQELELENKNLRDTLDQYNAEFAEIKNQEVTIRQLREKVRGYEDGMEELVEERVKEKESSLKKHFDERERQLQDAGGILSLKVQEAERRAEALQSSLTAAQQELFQLRSRADDSQEARASEIDMLLADLERSNQMKETVERELEITRKQMEELQGRGNAETSSELQLNDSEGAGPGRAVQSMEIELTAKEKQMSQLLEEVRKLNLELDSVRGEWEEKERRLVEELTQKSSVMDVLEARLKGQTDYDDIQRELHVLKSIEFGESQEGPSNKTLEVLLLEKNKALQAENTALKVARRELDGAVDPATKSDCSTPPGPFQHVVEAVGCFLGAELVSAYNKLAEECGQSLETEPPAETAPQVDLGPVMEQQGELDLSQLLGKHSLFDLEEATKDGMPRYLAEAMATEQLQSLVADNVKGLGDTALSTTQVANHCRQLLALYNLGQRLFAKTILNQSQGSLSELLSKPRPWHRLTEKGREAFRKMYAWVSDERAVTLLRTLSPRRPYANAGSKPGTSTETAAKPSLDMASCTLPNDSVKEEDVSESGANPESPASSVCCQSLMSTSQSSAAAKFSTNNRWRHDDIPKEMIFEIYHRELQKLKEQEATLHQQLRGRSQKQTGRNVGRTHSSASNDSIRDIPNSQRCSETPESMPTASGSFPSGSGGGTRALKAVLPPISQEQFERFSNVNTEELVRKVKDFLTQQSISQRLFGEFVLGLSQGSVSDLLARPKPWHMLTQKGREPFIRMQMFLEDEEAVERLRNRKIAVSSNSPQTPQSNGLPSSQYVPILPRQTPPSLLTSSSQSPVSAPGIQMTPNLNSTSNSVRQRSRKSLPLVASVDEQNKLSGTGELDTKLIVEQVKDILHSNSIGQKLFGEAVLGVSQGTVSELLSKPKPWSLLSLRGREPYIRMHWWLQDSKRVDKLQQYNLLSKNSTANGAKRPYDVMNSDWSKGFHPDSLFGPPGNKKSRALITDQQKEALRFAFDHEPYPSTTTIELLARELSLSVRTVVNWFHNHRMRVKLQQSSSVLSMVSRSSSLNDCNRQNSPDENSAQFWNGETESKSEETGGTWRQELLDLISVLSTSEDQNEGHSGEEMDDASLLFQMVKEEPSSPSQTGEEDDEEEEERRREEDGNSRTALERRMLVEKLEKTLNQEELDWNAGIREEAISKLEQNLNSHHEPGLGWEF